MKLTAGGAAAQTRRYGHLSAKSITKKYAGQAITRGQIIGYIGNTAENGGWTGSHLHFQCSVHPPSVPHDLPGVVSVEEDVIHDISWVNFIKEKE
jgi:hypothetical protein